MRSDPGWKNHFQHGIIIGYASQPDGLFIFSFFLKEMENSLSHKKDATNLLYKIYKLI